MKILSPAGNLESLKTAVYNGADEVYLGINDFNARNIQSFTIETLKEAVDFAHIYGVRVFLAVNILFCDQEFTSAVKTIVDAYNLGVDAFIIQDLGLAEYIHRVYPQIELHASTQMGIHNLEGVNQIEKYGFKRVVLARETPLKEIKRIRKNSDIEIEYFVQGALCVCFSGNCYLSSYLFDASGNRGKCKQLCRLPYSFRINEKTLKKGYLLSAKDFNMSKRLAELKDAGVTSLKIEGRARRPYYVATATRQYYNALHGKKPSQQKLELAFTRGYTEGYFNGNDNIISSIQSHVGVFVGRVEKVVNGNKFNEIYFTSNREISPKSTLKFFDGEKETNTLSVYDLKKTKTGYYTTTTQKIKNGLSVRLINDALEEQEALNYISKRKVDLTLNLTENAPIKAVTTINGKDIEIYGEVCFTANNRPITENDLAECFEKNEFFAPNLIIEKLDKVFMTKSLLNSFRREVFAKITQELTTLNHGKVEFVEPTARTKVNAFTDFCITQNEKGKYACKNVVYSPEEYALEKVLAFKKNCQNQGKTPYLDTPNFALEEDIKQLKNIVEVAKIGVVANNYYALGLSENVVIGWGLNVYNSFTANLFNMPIVTAESDLSTMITPPFMTLRHCPIKEHVGGSCRDCRYKNGYEYLTDDGRVLRLTRKKLSTCTFYLNK